MPNRLTDWLGRVLVAAVALAAVEVFFVGFFLPSVFSSGFGFVCYVIHLVAIFSFFSIPFALLARLFGGTLVAKVRARLPGPPGLTTAFIGVLLGTYLVTTLSLFPGGGQDQQFPERMDILVALGIFAVLCVLALICRFLIFPIVNRLSEHAPNLFRPGMVAANIILVTVLIGYWSVVFGLFAVHLTRLVPPVGVLIIWLAVASVGLYWPNPSLRAGRVLSAVLVGLFAIMPFTAWRDPPSRFILYRHSPLAGPLATLWRDLVDFDNDGASPTWLGGTDCAPFDASRGPLQRELPGDGVDQDCVGGDARADKHPPVPSAPDAPREGCVAVPGPLSVVLITLDAFRGDLLSPKITPNLDHFSRYTTLFQRAYAPATFTLHSLAALFQGTALSDLVPENIFRSSRIEVGRSLAEHLRVAGYRTAYINYLSVSEIVRRGFKEINPSAKPVDAVADAAFEIFMSSKVTNGAIDYLESVGAEPFLLWLHYPDLHAPYTNPGDQKFKAGEVTPYERVSAYVDHHVGRLLTYLRKQQLSSRTIVIITADHGEDLGIRGKEGHGPDLFDDTIHVPLMMWIPGCPPRVRENPVSLTQIPATIGALIDLPIPGDGLYGGGRDASFPVISESNYGLGRFTRPNFCRAVIDRRYKLIVDVRNGGRMLFDIARDPKEMKNLFSAEPALAKRLNGQYQNWLDRPRPPWLRDRKTSDLDSFEPVVIDPGKLY